jgi:hypothetical protein
VEFFSQEKTADLHLERLVGEVKDFFGVTEDDAAIRCERAHGNLESSGATKLEQFTHWACVHLLDRKIIKRVGPNKYQHISGPSPTYHTSHEISTLFDEALAFMRHARKLEFTLGDAKDMWKDRFPDDVLTRAANEVFV